MGSLQAHEMADLATLEQGITWHLRSNHYPPVPVSMVPVCIQAIDALNGEEYGLEIDLPDGITWNGSSTAPACEIVRCHHLEPWLEGEGY